MARILADPEIIVNTEIELEDPYLDTRTRLGDRLLNIVGEWRVDGSNLEDVERKVEELVWTSSIVYGVGGWSSGKPFVADFFL